MVRVAQLASVGGTELSRLLDRSRSTREGNPAERQSGTSASRLPRSQSSWRRTRRDVDSGNVLRRFSLTSSRSSRTSSPRLCGKHSSWLPTSQSSRSRLKLPIDSGSAVSSLQASQSCSICCSSPICHGRALRAFDSSRSILRLRSCPMSAGSVWMRFPLRQSSSSFWSDRQMMGSSRCSSLPVQSSLLKLTMRASGCCASTSRTRHVIPFPVRSSEAPLAEAETRGDLRQLSTASPLSRPRQPSLGVRGVRGEGGRGASHAISHQKQKVREVSVGLGRKRGLFQVDN